MYVHKYKCMSVSHVQYRLFSADKCDMSRYTYNVNIHTCVYKRMQPYIFCIDSTIYNFWPHQERRTHSGAKQGRSGNPALLSVAVLHAEQKISIFSPKKKITECEQDMSNFHESIVKLLVFYARITVLKQEKVCTCIYMHSLLTKVVLLCSTFWPPAARPVRSCDFTSCSCFSNTGIFTPATLSTRMPTFAAALAGTFCNTWETNLEDESHKARGRFRKRVLAFKRERIAIILRCRQIMASCMVCYASSRREENLFWLLWSISSGWWLWFGWASRGTLATWYLILSPAE